FFLALATRRRLSLMAKAELFGYPVLKQLMTGLGAFPVLRNADEGRAVARGVELLERGEAIAIFPQGTAIPYRNRPYRRGAARLAGSCLDRASLSRVLSSPTREPTSHEPRAGTAQA